MHSTHRRVVRGGLYRFLKLVVELRYGIHTEPEHTWFTAAGAYDLGLELGVRFSGDVMELDRAKGRGGTTSRRFLPPPIGFR